MSPPLESPQWIQETPRGLLLHLQIQPGSSKTQIVGPHGEPPRLKIKIAAPPVEGAANEALLHFLKKALRVPTSQLELIRGQTSKFKDVLISPATALSLQEIAVRLRPQ